MSHRLTFFAKHRKHTNVFWVIDLYNLEHFPYSRKVSPIERDELLRQRRQVIVNYLRDEQAPWYIAEKMAHILNDDQKGRYVQSAETKALYKGVLCDDEDADVDRR